MGACMAADKVPLCALVEAIDADPALSLTDRTSALCQLVHDRSYTYHDLESFVKEVGTAWD